MKSSRVLLCYMILICVLPVLVIETVVGELRMAWRNLYVIKSLTGELRKWRAQWRIVDHYRRSDEP